MGIGTFRKQFVLPGKLSWFPQYICATIKTNPIENCEVSVYGLPTYISTTKLSTLTIPQQ